MARSKANSAHEVVTFFAEVHALDGHPHNPVQALRLSRQQRNAPDRAAVTKAWPAGQEQQGKRSLIG